MLGLMGYNGRSLLSEITDTDPNADIEEGGFPFGWSRQIEIAGRPVLACAELCRRTRLGAVHRQRRCRAVYGAIVEAGAGHGLVHAGFHAMNSLRLEAGMRHWGRHTDEDTPIEAGLGFAIDWDKGEFLDRDPPSRRMRPARRLIQFRIEDPDHLTYHDEPIYRDGIVVQEHVIVDVVCDPGPLLRNGHVRHPDGESITAAWLDGRREVNMGGGWFRCRHDPFLVRPTESAPPSRHVGLRSAVAAASTADRPLGSG